MKLSQSYATINEILIVYIFLIMTTHSKKEILIDLFNLPPLPDERNALEAYMDVPHNFYIPDRKNTRLMDCVERREFERQTVDNNEGFVL